MTLARNTSFAVAFALVVVAAAGGILWIAKVVSARVSAASVQAQVIEVDGARYVVVTSTDGVAVCPAVKP